MKSPHTKTRLLPEGSETSRLAAAAIKGGEVIAFRTDTFYGLGADPFNRRAVEKIKALKGREANKPILIIISDAAAAERFIAHKSKAFSALAAGHWPGALTLVVPARAEAPEELTARTGTIGVRLPADERVRALVRAGGGALTATSANPAGKPPASTADEVAAYFPEGLSLIIDGGSSAATQPSTVIAVMDDEPSLLRAGAIAWNDLQATLRKAGV